MKAAYRVYNIDPESILGTVKGAFTAWTGPVVPTGGVVVSGADVLPLSGDISNFQTAFDPEMFKVSAPGPLGKPVSSWSLRDMSTQEVFAVARLSQNEDAASACQTLSEKPLIAGRQYEIRDFKVAAPINMEETHEPVRSLTGMPAVSRSARSEEAALSDIESALADAGVSINVASKPAQNSGVVCFAGGTKVATPRGEIAIENLAVGDLVQTMDNGLQAIRWIGSSKVKATGELAPIRFRAGALRNAKDLLVSPEHRMLLSGWEAEVLFGQREVLVSAKMLVNGESVTRVEGGNVDYYHMLFDRHEIVFAEGSPSESFHPGKSGWDALADASRAEILQLFPDLPSQKKFPDFGPSARVNLEHGDASIARSIETLVH